MECPLNRDGINAEQKYLNSGEEFFELFSDI